MVAKTNSNSSKDLKNLRLLENPSLPNAHGTSQQLMDVEHENGAESCSSTLSNEPGGHVHSESNLTTRHHSPLANASSLCLKYFTSGSREKKKEQNHVCCHLCNAFSNTDKHSESFLSVRKACQSSPQNVSFNRFSSSQKTPGFPWDKPSY